MRMLQTYYAPITRLLRACYGSYVTYYARYKPYYAPITRLLRTYYGYIFFVTQVPYGDP